MKQVRGLKIALVRGMSYAFHMKFPCIWLNPHEHGTSCPSPVVDCPRYHPNSSGTRKPFLFTNILINYCSTTTIKLYFTKWG